MKGRKINKSHFRFDCSISSLLWFTTRISCLLFITGIVSAYFIQKLGYVSPIEDDTISDGNPASADTPTDSYWLFTFWANSNKDGRRFRHQYPTVYTLCRRVDTAWRAVFNTIDNICSTTTLYVGYTLVSISQLASAFYRKSAAVSLDILTSVYYHDYDVILSKFNLTTVLTFATVLGISALIFVLFKRWKSGQSVPGEVERESFVEELTRKPVHEDGVVKRQTCTRRRSLSLTQCVLLLFGVCCLVSLPWEFIRIYQIEVAKKAAITLKGSPAECMPETMSLWSSVKAWIQWTFTWTDDPCERYHQAVLVDPLWEVTPLIVLSSLLTRCFTTPFHSLSATLGASIRALMSEIPLPWQPFFIATILVVILFGVVATCRYRVIMPLFLRIEPSHKTPVIIRTCGSSNCIKAARIKYKNRRILAIECSPGDDKRNYCKVGDDLDCSSEIIDLSDSF